MKKKSRRNLPPPTPPANADEYILVRTKEGPHWRRKRGSIKEAKLNPRMQQNADSTAFFNSAAKRIKDKLDEFLRGLEISRFNVNVSGKLKKKYNQSGELNFSLLQGYELQPYHPLGKLLKSPYRISDEDRHLIVTIPIDADAVKQLSSLVTAYYFEIILLYGNPSLPNGLRIDSDTSRLYSFNEKEGTMCRLSLDLPPKKVPWILILKISCHEGDSLALHCRHYGMKIVKAG